VDFGVICGLLILNAVVGFLKQTLALKATVTRNGHVLEIDAEEVVPGDVVHLEDVSIL
jgi:H+-transporting ATPase